MSQVNQADQSRGNAHLYGDTYNINNENDKDIIETNNNSSINDDGIDNGLDYINTNFQDQNNSLDKQQDPMLTDGMEKQLYQLLGRTTKVMFDREDKNNLNKVLKAISNAINNGNFSNNETKMEFKNKCSGVLNLVEKANRKLRDLDKLKGMDDFAAMFDNPEDKSKNDSTGKLDNPKDTKKSCLYIEAMNAQAELAEKLKFIMNNVDFSNCNDYYEILDEMQFKCNARITEISRWASQMKALYELYKDNQLKEPKPGAKSKDGFTFDTKVSEALAELSPKMHGTADALKELATSNKEVRDFLQTLDDFANSEETGEIPQEDYENLIKNAQKFQEVLKEVAVNGWLVNETDVSQRENKHASTQKDIEKENAQQPAESKIQTGARKLDSATLKLMAKFLKKTQEESQKEDALRHAVLSEAMQRMIDAEISLPKSLQTLKIITSYLGQDSKLVQFFRAHEEVVSLLKRLAKNPQRLESFLLIAARGAIAQLLSPELISAVKEELESKKWSTTLDKIKKNVYKKVHGEDKLFESHEKILAELEKLMGADDPYNEMMLSNDFRLIMDNDGELYRKRIQTVLNFLFKNHDIQNNMKDVKTRQFIKGLFHGRYPVSSLIETRLHGVKDEDIQVEAEDSKLTKKTPLHEGAANKVFLCEYSNGHKFVFKPELSGLEAIRNKELGKGLAYSDKTKLYHLNIASRKCAEAFGLQDTIVAAKAGVLQGQFGLFMEVAPGININSKKKINELKKQINATEDKNLLYKNMFSQFNKLQWLDLLTGNGDRHTSNFMLAISEDQKGSTVSLKGIDNDLCFSEHLLGVNKYLITSEQCDSMTEKIQSSLSKFGIDMNDKATNERANEILNECFQKDKNGNRIVNNDGSLILDMNWLYIKINDSVNNKTANRYMVDEKEQSKDDLIKLLIGEAIKQTIGCQSYGMPSYITKTLYEKLIEVKNMSFTHKKQFIESFLGGRVSEKAIEAFKTRLDELINHAETLEENGKVLDEQGQDDSWKEVYNNAQNEAKVLGEVVDENVPKGKTKQNEATNERVRNSLKKTFSSDYFFNFMNQIKIEHEIK